jgi:hypothetical protein
MYIMQASRVFCGEHKSLDLKHRVGEACRIRKHQSEHLVCRVNVIIHYDLRLFLC